MGPWDRAIVRHDIRELPYPDASVDAVYSSHALEHLYLADAQRVLHEVLRVLRPGGILRLALPDSERLVCDFAKRFDAGDPLAGADFNRQLLAHPEHRPTGIRRFVFASGGHIHRWQPSVAHVKQLLCDAGFVDVEELSFRQGRLPDVERIESRPESFFLEATAP